MPRPRKDGTKAQPANKVLLTELAVRRFKTESVPLNVWDARCAGLVLRVQPSEHRAFKFVYSFRGRPRWYHIGQIGLIDARRIAAKLRLAVVEGRDPVAERKAERGQGTFRELALRYRQDYAARHNKSWLQAAKLVDRYLMPKWGDLDVTTIARRDVRELIGKIDRPILANQVLAAASAIFTWGVKDEVVAANPCQNIDRNPTKARERILADDEIRQVWAALDAVGSVAGVALKMILLTGQRPGEVAAARWEHVRDGWWMMPGLPVTGLQWPGLKNAQSHAVWLSEPVRKLLAALDDSGGEGFVFGSALTNLGPVMRDICKRLGCERATPHDLRRTFGSTVTRLGHGRQAMDRLLNHADRSVGSIYDRHSYMNEDKAIMERVGDHIVALTEGRITGTVVRGRF